MKGEKISLFNVLNHFLCNIKRQKNKKIHKANFCCTNSHVFVFICIFATVDDGLVSLYKKPVCLIIDKKTSTTQFIIYLLKEKYISRSK